MPDSPLQTQARRRVLKWEAERPSGSWHDGFNCIGRNKLREECGGSVVLTPRTSCSFLEPCRTVTFRVWLTGRMYRNHSQQWGKLSILCIPVPRNWNNSYISVKLPRETLKKKKNKKLWKLVFEFRDQNFALPIACRGSCSLEENRTEFEGWHVRCGSFPFRSCKMSVRCLLIS